MDEHSTMLPSIPVIINININTVSLVLAMALALALAVAIIVVMGVAILGSQVLAEGSAEDDERTLSPGP